jgi:hypothetical protein
MLLSTAQSVRALFGMGYEEADRRRAHRLDYRRLLGHGPREGVVVMPDEAEILADAMMALAAVRLARKLPREQLRAIVAALRDNGAHALAEAVIGKIPFQPKLERESLMQ